MSTEGRGAEKEGRLLNGGVNIGEGERRRGIKGKGRGELSLSSRGLGFL